MQLDDDLSLHGVTGVRLGTKYTEGVVRLEIERVGRPNVSVCLVFKDDHVAEQFRRDGLAPPGDG